MSTVSTQTLLEWAKTHTSESRAALAETITSLFAEDSQHLSDRERALMGDILRKIVGDLERAVRRSMSERLADLDDAPPELIRFLANDEADVAYPVLTRSGVLQDEDLIEIIRNRTLEHQLAIAVRYTVSERVTGALVATGSTSVIESLLRNQNAEISQATLAFLVDESRRMDSFREPLLLRRELGPELAKRMFLWVSAALRNRIITRFGLDETTVDTLLEQAALENIEEAEQDDPLGGADRLAEELDNDSQLDPETLVRALAMGEVNLFVALFARATQLRDRLVRRMLFAARGDEFAIACKAAEFPRETFETLFQISRSARPQLAAQGPDATRAALAAYDGVSHEDADRILQRWRLDPDYVAAIGELEAAAGGHG